MNTSFPTRRKTSEARNSSVFDELRRRLAQEAPCMGLANLLESVNSMQRAQNTPEQFDLRFEEFVYRAEEYTAAVRPYFPALVVFLSSRGAEDGIEPRSVDASEQSGPAGRVA